jgi:hypothetical protein
MFCTFTLALIIIIIVVVVVVVVVVELLHLLWRNNPTQAWAVSLLKFLDHTQTRTHAHTQ